MDMAVHSYCQFCKHLLSWGGCYNDCCIDGNRFEAAVTPEDFAKRMIKLKERCGHDPEYCHSKMDHLMCSVLNQLGYEHGVKVFEDTEKWYA